MKIWTTVIGQRLDDAQNTRSMLLCQALIDRGHDVTMWTSSYDHINKVWREQWQTSPDLWVMPNGLKVRFMEGCGYTSNVSVRRFYDHWLAGRSLKKKAASLELPDVIVASIPDHLTAAAAADLARQHDIALVVDVRDKWPDIFIDYAKGARLKALVTLGLSAERRRAAGALRSADAVVGMMQSMIDWGLDRAGRAPTPKDRVFYLTTADRNFGPDMPPAEGRIAELAHSLAGRVVFSFTGTFNQTQHPSLLLDALERLEATGRIDPDKTAFVIGGTGTGEEQLTERAKRFGNVHLTGWLNSRELQAVLRLSDVGLLLMNFPSPAFNNKAFSYLASGLPIINGATGDLAALIAANDLGINVDGGDVDQLAAAIVALASNTDLRAGMRQATEALYQRQFDREANYSAYAQHIEEVVRGRKSGRP